MLVTDKFRPPFTDVEVIGKHASREGNLERVTMLLEDANHRMFSLTVATSNDYEQRILDERDHGDVSSETEPVFVIPEAVLDANVLEAVMKLPPELLGSFLVEQESQA